MRDRRRAGDAAGPAAAAPGPGRRGAHPLTGPDRPSPQEPPRPPGESGSLRPPGIIGFNRRPTGREWRRAWLAFAAGVVALVVFGSLIRQPARLLSLGGAAPAFTLTSASGQQVNALQAAAHHNLVIQFFDTICDTCRSQASQLCRLAVEHSSDVFVGVDAAPEDASALLGYAQRYQPQPCPVALFPDPGLKVSQAYRAAVVPTLYVVDSGGKIAYAAVGTAGVNELPATLQRLGG